jgi:hypothetical protein
MEHPPHNASHYSAECCSVWKIERKLSCPNSPDWNKIGPYWFWMKREIIKGGPVHSEVELKVAWIICGNEPKRKFQLGLRG